MLDPFSGSSTTGIAANLLNRRYLGLEIETKFLEMSKARRQEIENHDIRKLYLNKLSNNGCIMPSDIDMLAEPNDIYNVPWL